MKTDKIKIHPSTMASGKQTEELTIHYNGNVHLGLNTRELQEKIFVNFNPKTHDVVYRWRDKDYSETGHIKKVYAEYLSSILRREFTNLRNYVSSEIAKGSMDFCFRYLGRTFRCMISLNFDGRGNFKADWIACKPDRGVEAVMCEPFKTYPEASQFLWRSFEEAFGKMWKQEIDEDYDEYVAKHETFRECPKCGDPLDSVDMRADGQVYLLGNDLAEHDVCLVYSCQECCHELAHSYEDMVDIMSRPRRTDAKQG